MGYYLPMEIKIIETSIFNKAIVNLLSEEEYTAFKNYISKNPDIAPVIQGTGRARKNRWARKGHVRSGGIRILYFYRSKQGDIFS